ncbi:hypothetical protein [Alloscardovia theropitheci]|nr:hypothetical protein [Alloscardovia theropitheci]
MMLAGNISMLSAWLNYRQWIPAILFAVTAEVLYRYDRKRIG